MSLSTSPFCMLGRFARRRNELSRRNFGTTYTRRAFESLEPRAMLALSSVQLGEQDFVDGGRYTNLNVVNQASANEPYPFNGFKGSDAFLGPSNASFPFSTSSIPTDNIDELIMVFGILDHDSATPGDQVAEFTIDGVDFTDSMNALLESRGGAQVEYNVYTYVFPPGAPVADGSAEFVLRLKGPTRDDFGNILPEGTNGALLDFVRIGPSCAINLEPLEVEGEFIYNTDLNRCEASGTVLIGNGVGGPQIQVSGGTVWLNEQTLEATGTFSGQIGGVWTELFTATGTINLTGSNDNELVLSQPTPTTLPAAMRPAWLPVDLSSVRWMPTEVQFEGAFALPEFVGGLTLTPQHFLLGGAGLMLAGGFISVPNIDVSLFGALQVRTSGLSAGYNANENEIELWGSLTIKSLTGSSGPSITATFPQGNGIGIGPDGVDFNGTIMASDLGVVPGLFTLKNLSLSVNVQDSTLISIGGAAKVQLVSGVQIDGSFNIVGGQLDAVALSGSGLRFPIGSTGLFLQRVGGSVSGLAEGGLDPTFTGTVGFSFGPEYTIELPEAFGGTFENVSLLSIDLSASATIDFFDFANSEVVLQASATVALLGGVATGSGSIRLDFRRVELEVDTTFTALAGFIQSQTHLSANAALNLSASGSASITIPDSVPLVGGTELFGGHMFLNYRHNETLSDDYIAGYADITTWFGTFRTGARVNFDGTATVLGLVPLDEASPSPSGALPAGANGGVPLSASRSFTVQSGTGFALLSATWSNEMAGVPIRVIDPNGTEHTPANFGTVVDYVDEFTGGKRATVAIREPMPGTWTIELPDTSGLGAVAFEAFGGAEEPTVAFGSPTGAVPGGQVSIAFAVEEENPGASVDLYADTDGQGFDGRQIASALPPGTGEYVWDTFGLAEGAYHIYAVVSDDVSAPVFQYAPGQVRVGDEVLRTLSDEFAINDVFAVTDGHDVAGNGRGDFVAVWGSYQETPTPGAAIYARRFGADGQHRGPEFRVSDERELNGVPAVAIDATGDFVVAWEVDAIDAQRVVARRYDSTGGPFGDVFDVSELAASIDDVAVEMLPSGGFAVAWVEEFEDEVGESLGSHVMLRRFAADGMPLGPPAPVSGAMNGPEGAIKYHPSLSTSDNAWIVAWGASNDVTDENNILARMIGLDGVPLTEEISVAAGISDFFDIDDDKHPVLDAASDGSFIVAWQATDPDQHITEVRRFTADGTAIGDDISLFEMAGPAVLNIGGGNGGLAVQSFGDFFGYLLWRIGDDGLSFSPLVPITGYAEDALLAGDMAGSFVGAWTDGEGEMLARVFEGAAATTLPRVVSGELETEGGRHLRVRFNKDVRDSVDATDLIVTNLDTGTVVSSTEFVVELDATATMPTVARWRPVAGLPAGDYAASVPAGSVVDAYGRTNENEFHFEFSIATGDFDANGLVDDRDIDLLFAQVASGSHFAPFDLNGDALVDAADLRYLVETVLTTRIGDANLDGKVDRADAALVAVNFGRTGPAAWARGDFNGDGRTDLVDLAIQQGALGFPLATPSALVAAVPTADRSARNPVAVAGGAAGTPQALFAVASRARRHASLKIVHRTIQEVVPSVFDVDELAARVRRAEDRAGPKIHRR